MNPESVYHDGDTTCAQTYATLLMHHEERHPETVTSGLGLIPARMTVRGELRFWKQDRWIESRWPKRNNFWSFTSKASVESRDSLRHIDWVLQHLEGKDHEFAQLVADGWEPTLSVFWYSDHGHGGPVTTPLTMKRLAQLEIPLWFDFYDSDDEPDPSDADPGP